MEIVDFSFKCEQIIEAVSDSLCAVRSAMEAMCRRDADLVTADAAFQFMMDQLKDQAHTNPWSAKLIPALEKRFMERRTKYSGVLDYLKTGKVSSEWDPTEQISIFPVPTRQEVLSCLYGLLALHTKEDEPVTLELEATDSVSYPLQTGSQELNLSSSL